MISACASRILAAEGASEVPKLECDSSAALGVRPKRRISSAASSVISAEMEVGLASGLELDAALRQHEVAGNGGGFGGAVVVPVA